MARERSRDRRDLDAALRQARALEHQPMGPDLPEQIRAAIGDRSNLLIAAGASAAAAHRLAALIPELTTAFDRLLEDPVARDPRCHGKTALLKALDGLGWDDDRIYLRAVGHIQLEPVWGGSEDSATVLRISAAEALVHLGHPDLLRILGDLLADPSVEVRGAAAQLLGQVAGPGAALLLRLRLLTALEARPGRQQRNLPQEHLDDYAGALLIADGARSVPLVADLLDDPELAEAAALALGGSRLTEALTPLADELARTLLPERQGILLTAIALHRSDAAVALLLDLVAEGPIGLAVQALPHLKPLRERPAVDQRLRETVRQRNDPRLSQALEPKGP